ncbi:MAG: ABC transporter ATP-binding protein [Deltaproteobacteria bacterium]|nr:ABC transporter ATP-binding protein [Deltaproteobacteria bacterium]
MISASPAPPVLVLNDVCFSYSRNAILEHVDLTLRQGDFLAVLGPNGGGKTTLVKLILGLIRPVTGRIEVFGLPPGKAACRVGYVPQKIHAGRGFPVTALDATLMGLIGAPSRKSRRKDKDLAMNALARVGMENQAGNRMDRLSGGQIQRVLVARALISDPDFLVFDEPTASIDPLGKHCIYEMLSDIAQGVTVMVVSHDLVMVSMASARITCVAAVNRRLIFNRGTIMGEDMLTLIYGEHGHACPMENAIQDMHAMFAGRAAPETRP